MELITEDPALIGILKSCLSCRPELPETQTSKANITSYNTSWLFQNGCFQYRKQVFHKSATKYTVTDT